MPLQVYIEKSGREDKIRMVGGTGEEEEVVGVGGEEWLSSLLRPAPAPERSCPQSITNGACRGAIKKKKNKNKRRVQTELPTCF